MRCLCPHLTQQGGSLAARPAQVKSMRKEVADLLRTNKQENARIRVEAAMRENLLLQAYEVRAPHE